MTKKIEGVKYHVSAVSAKDISGDFAPEDVEFFDSLVEDGEELSLYKGVKRIKNHEPQ